MPAAAADQDGIEGRWAEVADTSSSVVQSAQQPAVSMYASCFADKKVTTIPSDAELGKRMAGCCCCTGWPIAQQALQGSCLDTSSRLDLQVFLPQCMPLPDCLVLPYCNGTAALSAAGQKPCPPRFIATTSLVPGLCFNPCVCMLYGAKATHRQGGWQQHPCHP